MISSRSPRVVLLSLVLGLTLVAVPGFAGQNDGTGLPPIAAPTTIDLTTPEKTLASFATAILRGDWDNAVRCVKGATPGPLTELLKTEPHIPIASFQVTKVKLNPVGGTALVAATYTPVIAMINGTEGVASQPEATTLEKGPTGWQIVPIERTQFQPEKNGMLTELAFLLANPEVEVAGRTRARESREQARHKLDSMFGGEPRFPVGSEARLYHDKDRSAVPVAPRRPDLEAYVIYQKLKELREEHPEPFVKARKGFSDGDYADALAKAKATADKAHTSGQILLLPYGTRVRVIEHPQSPRFTDQLASTDNDLQRALNPESQATAGVWRVQVLTGGNKGKTVWTYDLQGIEWAPGDFVKVAIPNRPTAKVVAATDWDASQALTPKGREAGDSKAKARFDRLVRERRFVLVPAKLRCVVVDETINGAVALLKPLEGPYKNKTLYVRSEHVLLEGN